MHFHESIPMRLRRAYLTVHRTAQAHFARFGMTADQYVLLSLLADKDGITQKELSSRMCSDGNTITAMLCLLERKGLIQRERCSADGKDKRPLIVFCQQSLKSVRRSWHNTGSKRSWNVKDCLC